jgi:hypothetical protein
MSEDMMEGVASENTTTEPKKVYCCPGYEAQCTTKCPTIPEPQMPPHLKARMEELDEQMAEIHDAHAAACERDFRPTGSEVDYWRLHMRKKSMTLLSFHKTNSDASYQQLHDEATVIMKEFHNSPEYKQYKEEKHALVEAHHNQCTCGKKEYHYEGEGLCRDCGEETFSVTKVSLVTGETSQSVECSYCDAPYDNYDTY